VTNAILGGFAGFALTDWIADREAWNQSLLIPAALWDGGPERLLALLLPPFFHASLPHLAIDCMLLLLVGPAAEQVYGRGRVVVSFLFAGFLAVVASAALRPDEALAAGSGAVLGVVGLLLGFLTFRQGALPEVAASRLKLALAGGTVAEIAMGVLQKRVNNVAHLGGLVAGFLLAAVLRPRLASPRRLPVEILAALVLAAGFGRLYLESGRRVEGTLAHAVTVAEDHLMRDEVDRAQALLERALARDLRGSADQLLLPIAQNALAWCYVESGRNLERGIALSEESNRALPDEPMLLDTLGYLYALAGRCRDAADAMGRAAELDRGYERRREEVNHACSAGRRPNPDLPVEESGPTPTPSPRRRGGIPV
jgi:membrane associated rhomboid family serine protease